MPQDVERKLVEIIRRTAHTKKTVDLTTSVNNDLGVDGLDAADLIDAIWKEFQTDFKGFDFNKYFREEGPAAIFPWTLKKKKALSVQHLLDVVRKGCWFE